VKVQAILLASAACLLLVGSAYAQSGDGPYQWTIDGGGVTYSTGGGYTLGGTAGQPDANVLRGGEYTLAGGLWPGGETVREPREVYMPLVIRGH